MKRWMFTILACLTLCLGLIPAIAVPAGATGGTITVGGVELEGSGSEPAYATTDKSGNVTACGESDGWTIQWDGSTLTLRGAGILNGTGDGSTLSPQGSATRAQLAVMLYRWLA